MGNTLGFITGGAEKLGEAIASDTEGFVKGVQNIFSNAGQTLSGGVQQGAEDIVKGAEKLGSDIENGIDSLVNGVKNLFKGL